MAKYRNEAGEIDSHEYPINLSKYALDAYKYFNLEHIPDDIMLENDIFKNSIKIISKAHNFPDIGYLSENNMSFNISENNKVLMACSGGLDSIYQACMLIKQGYEVILFHCKNMNYYSNGKEYAVVKDFARKEHLRLITFNFNVNIMNDNPYKKFWFENSFKNMLLYSMMVDVCIAENIYYISSGDDMHLTLNKAVVGTNISDAREVTQEFLKDLHNIVNIEFLSINGGNKIDRMKYIQENNLLDSFYSCVNPGRFNQLNHNKTQNKFGVKLEQYNCGVCRKCAFHTLIRHYYMNVDFPQDFIDYTWTKIANGADNVFFNKNIPLDIRIKNLLEY